MRLIRPSACIACIACITVAMSLLATACTTLGPMPAMSSLPPQPAPRTGVEVQAGGVPGYFLSSSVQDKVEGATISQLAVLVDAGSLVGAPGLVVGGRYVGKSDQGGYPEPVAGYRWYPGLQRWLAVGLLGYATHASGADNGASYSATRGGVDAGVDLRLTPGFRWVELHLVGTASLLVLSAKGTYCTDDEGRFALECADPGDGPLNQVTARVGGLYPAGGMGIAVDSLRHLSTFVHGVRLMLNFAAGTMPRVEMGEQRSAALWAALGLTLTVGLGATE